MNRDFANNCCLTFDSDSHVLKDYLYRVARRYVECEQFIFQKMVLSQILPIKEEKRNFLSIHCIYW